MSLGHPIVEVVVERGLRSLWEGSTDDCSTVMGKEPSLSPKLDFPRFPPPSHPRPRQEILLLKKKIFLVFLV